ncbi:MAG TPA: hypothetical protein VLV78_14930 [Thermoanaerobaculia bacterium]|nr:hypothetical protein [Thermoanaerobaculia bacterium]
MKPFSLHRGDAHGDLAGTVLCHDVRGAFRKGHVLRPEDIPGLIGAEWSELHLLQLGPDDVGQHEAGQLLAQMLSNPGVHAAPSGHRHVLKATHNGLLKIDVAALQRINSIPGIAVFTLMNDSVVSADQVVAEAQITPLAIEKSAIEKVARESGIIRNLPFPARDVVVRATDDRLIRNLTAKLEWFGCNVSVERRPSRLSSVGTLQIVTGSNALDPLDPVFVELENAGAKMQRIGMPVHPGTLLWIATWNEATIIGLPSCGHGQQLTAFDLVFPKILAEGVIRDDDLAALGHGGILNVRRPDPSPSARLRMTEHEPVR